ncbi:hypothetical protein BC332_18788 [Capsicum chinense]|nr:hypothetical protein BC332_18788 [Capsicum chinense]
MIKEYQKEDKAEVHSVEITEVEVGVEDLNKGTSISKREIEAVNYIIIVRGLGMCKQIVGTRRNKQIMLRQLMKKVKRTLGKLSRKEGTSKAHHGTFDDNDVTQMKQKIKWDDIEPFHVIPMVYREMQAHADLGGRLEQEWHSKLYYYLNKFPEEAAEFKLLLADGILPGWECSLPKWSMYDPLDSTRGYSGKCLNALAKVLPGLTGGSADLASSNQAYLHNFGDFKQPGSLWGRNIRMGDLQVGGGIKKLNNQNYNSWSICMMSYLQGQYLWEVVHENEVTSPEAEDTNGIVRKWRIKAGKAMFALKTTVKENVLEHIRDAKTPQKAWDTFAKMFSKKNDTKFQLLEFELLSVSQCDMTISQYFHKVKSLCREISELDLEAPIGDTRIKRIIIHGLKP